MAKKKAKKKVDEVKEEIIDLEDYDEDDFEDEEEFDDEEEFEVKKKKVKKEKKEIVEEKEELTLDERVKLMEKKLNIVMILTIVIAVIATVSMFIIIFKGTGSSKKKTETTENNEETQEVIQEYDVSAFKEVSASEVSGLGKDKVALLYIGRSTCGYCVQYVPTLTSVQKKYGYTTYYLDIAKIYDYSAGVVLDSDAESVMLKLKTSDSQKGVMDNFGATPMVLVIKNGKITDSLIGYVDEGTFDAFVVENGLNK